MIGLHVTVAYSTTAFRYFAFENVRSEKTFEFVGFTRHSLTDQPNKRNRNSEFYVSIRFVHIDFGTLSGNIRVRRYTCRGVRKVKKLDEPYKDRTRFWPFNRGALDLKKVNGG